MTTEQHRHKIQKLCNRLWAAMEEAVNDGEVVYLNNIDVHVEGKILKNLMVIKK